MGNFKVAASVEANLVSDAIVANGVVIRNPTGYGLTGNWTCGDWSVSANVAYLDAVDENNLAAGVNALGNNFSLGYIDAINEYKNKEFSSWAEGEVNASTWYACLRIPGCT